MPCPPGFVPVAKVDQATGVWAGQVVATREKPPCAAQPREVGQLARGEHRLDDLRFEPIQPDHDDLLDGRSLPEGLRPLQPGHLPGYPSRLIPGHTSPTDASFASPRRGC